MWQQRRAEQIKLKVDACVEASACVGFAQDPVICLVVIFSHCNALVCISSDYIKLPPNQKGTFGCGSSRGAEQIKLKVDVWRLLLVSKLGKVRASTFPQLSNAIHSEVGFELKKVPKKVIQKVLKKSTKQSTKQVKLRKVRASTFLNFQTQSTAAHNLPHQSK